MTAVFKQHTSPLGLYSILLFKAGPPLNLDQVAQCLVKLNLESLHWWRLHPSGAACSSVCPHWETFPPYIHSESSLFQFMPFILPPCTSVRILAVHRHTHTHTHIQSMQVLVPPPLFRGQVLWPWPACLPSHSLAPVYWCLSCSEGVGKTGLSNTGMI